MTWSLKKSLQDLSARETGSIRKDWGGKTSICLVYPNEYRIGMGNLAVHAIYDRLNRRGDIVCERAFLPDMDDLPEYARGGAPVMSIESQRPLAEFDVIAFTISFENDYLNIIPILSMSRIPHRRDARSGNPVLVAGGAAVTLNPKPISAIFDAIFLGEFEAIKDEFIEYCFASPLPLPSPLWGEGAGEGGAALCRKFIMNLDEYPTQTIIYNDDAEFGNLHLIEVQRGCPRGCKFCATPSLYHPPRFRSAECVMRMVDTGLAQRKKFGLIGADILSHPEFVEIATAIHARGAAFSPSSVRVDAIDDVKAKLLATSGHRSISLGIEAGSEALRGTLAKKTSDEQIITAVKILAANGIARLRLYFMIGLPGEAEDDIAAIAGLARRIQKATNGTIDLTISPFIPKPGTPFEHEKFAGEKYLKGCVRLLRRFLQRDKEISISCHSIIDATAEAYLASAGEDAIEFLEDVHRRQNLRLALKRK